MTVLRQRIARDCAVTIKGQTYTTGTEIDPALLGRALEEIPAIDLRLEILSAHKFIEYTTERKQVSLRPVSAHSFATRARAASVQVGPDGRISQRLAARKADDGRAELQRRLALSDDADGRVRRNPYFKESRP